MGAPHVHADLSVLRFGGRATDYIAIHELMDSSKQTCADLRHRVLTHNTWFMTTILERIFGATIENSDGKAIAVREIAQWHIMEDYNGSIPTVQDFLMNMSFQPWMNNGENGAVPPSNDGLPPFDKSLLEPGKNKKVLKKSLLEENKDVELPPAFMVFEGDNPRRGGCGGGGRLD